MTTTSNPSRIEYPQVTVQRAQRALKCSPFRLTLFQALRSRSIPLAQIAHQTGIDNEYSTVVLSELKAENELAWLIQVGLLRREVDGQGITDSFRLTPLGRQIIGNWETETEKIPSPSLLERVRNFLIRWFRSPF
jgi:hypothetical protein